MFSSKSDLYGTRVLKKTPSLLLIFITKQLHHFPFIYIIGIEFFVVQFSYFKQQPSYLIE
jgi:hypothetical protein